MNMNTDSLNKSQVIEMMLRVYDVRDHVLADKTVYEMYHGEKAYLWNLLWKLNKLLHGFGNQYTLCAYCQNHLDHNLGDHKLAVERQRITNENKMLSYQESDEDEFFVPSDMYDIWKNSQ